MAEIIDARWVIRKLYKRPGSDSWYGNVRDDRSGRVWRISTHTANQKHAKQSVLDFIREVETREERREAPGVRFDSAYEEFLGLKHVRPSTAIDYRCTFEGVYKPAFGDLLLGDIDMGAVERFLSRPRADREPSAKTRRKYLTELRSFFSWAARRRYVAENPCAGIRVPRGPRRLATALSVDEARALLVACRAPTVLNVRDHRRRGWRQSWEPPPHLFLAVLIALHTGLRRGNVLRLRWSQVDLGQRKIRIPAEEMKADADHEVPVHPELADVLEGLLRGRKRIDPGETVLGRELKGIPKSFKGALRRAGLPPVRWHDLRHTAASWWSGRASFAALRQLLGHSPGAVTLRYTHVRFDELRRVVDAGPRLLAAAGTVALTSPAEGVESAAT